VPVVVELELERSDHAELAVKATLVEPVDVLDRRDLEVLHIGSGPASAKQLCFRDRSTTSERLVGGALEANGCHSTGFREPLRVADAGWRDLGLGDRCDEAVGSGRSPRGPDPRSALHPRR
jgi:hypothetical protein